MTPIIDQITFFIGIPAASLLVFIILLCVFSRECNKKPN